MWLDLDKYVGNDNLKNLICIFEDELVVLFSNEQTEKDSYLLIEDGTLDKWM